MLEGDKIIFLGYYTFRFLTNSVRSSSLCAPNPLTAFKRGGAYQSRPVQSLKLGGTDMQTPPGSAAYCIIPLLLSDVGFSNRSCRMEG